MNTNLDLDRNGKLRLEERLIRAMRSDGLLVTDAIAEDVYAMRFNGEVSESSDFREVFARAKRNVGREVEAFTAPLVSEIQ